MSEKYKFNDPDGMYFVTMTVVGWVGARHVNCLVAGSTQMTLEIAKFEKSYQGMKTTKIREEIRDYISAADDRFIQMVYAMMKVNQEEAILTREEQEEVNRRAARHKSGESKSYSWPDARVRIEKGE